MSTDQSLTDFTPHVYGAIYVSPQSKVLVVKGRPTGKWSFPKGHSNENETAFACASREVLEETGLVLPQQYERLLTLATGLYYLIRSPEVKTEIRDPKEILEIRWMTYEELKGVEVNVDVNTFLRNYRNLLCAETPRETQRRNAVYLPRIPRLDE